MSAKTQSGAATAQVEEREGGVYERLCRLVDVQPLQEGVELEQFSRVSTMAETPLEKRMTAALRVFLDAVGNSTQDFERIDKALLDSFIARIDDMISRQLDEILHHPKFQRLESAWRGLAYMLEHCDEKADVKVDLIDISKEDLAEDFEEAPDTTQSGLYRHVYEREYDTPGGEPYSAIVSNYEFDSSAPDIALLSEVSRVAAAAHCPFLGSVGARFFGKDNIDDVARINDLSSYMERAEYIRWKAFRESEDARYIGLTLPRFLLRLPYGRDTQPVRDFHYEEQVDGSTHEKYLWGNASFAFAANMARSFKENGWAVNIRGPESGGKVENLPIHVYDAGHGLQSKIPTEILIPETRELEFANLGFIPLSYYKNRDYACFFSANSVQRPTEYSDDEATANSRINARLPYIFLISHLAHYLKVQQRENIGSSKSRQALEDELNDWLQGLVTKMKDPDPELIATHPLREGKVTVKAIPENPGYYSVTLHAQPHFQIEGVDVRLSLVSQMPGEEK
ncbi:MAG TPA: type VI secretion system contractile sheath large subunit [Chromatiales bacterium]|nr:type VI secretion system contractile sheath large subunit [Chromatiales bacterium]